AAPTADLGKFVCAFFTKLGACVCHYGRTICSARQCGDGRLEPVPHLWVSISSHCVQSKSIGARSLLLFAKFLIDVSKVVADNGVLRHQPCSLQIPFCFV